MVKESEYITKNHSTVVDAGMRYEVVGKL